jgi:hypothetical protein
VARLRSIKPEFFTSEQIVECSPMARLLFVGMWCFCDDAGVHPASVRRLKMEVFPGDSIEDSAISGLIGELLNNGLIESFSAQGKDWWAVTGWHHQKIDRPTFRYPSPPSRQHVSDSSTSDRRVIDEPSPPESSRVESIGVESIGVESKGRDTDPPAPPKGGKSTAKKKFIPPTVEEVRVYCVDRGNGIDAEHFHAHYTANGWVQSSGRPVKDWKACVITWEKNRKTAPPRTVIPLGRPLSDADKFIAEAKAKMEAQGK